MSSLFYVLTSRGHLMPERALDLRDAPRDSFPLSYLFRKMFGNLFDRFTFPVKLQKSKMLTALG